MSGPAAGADPDRHMGSYGEHFARIARRYDALREEATEEVVAWIADAASFAPGHDLVDIGCGTGATTVALARGLRLTATGVDPCKEMLEVARRRESGACRFIHGSAEQLPLPGGSFDRALMQTAVHLMDRRAAFAEARRVLRDPGLLVILTVDPSGVDDFWLAEWFPSYPAIDRQRFPAATTLAQELGRAGFGHSEIRRHTRRLQFTRDRALAMLRGRFASSFALMSDAEYAAGVARAECELPETFVANLHLLILTAPSGSARA